VTEAAVGSGEQHGASELRLGQRVDGRPNRAVHGDDGRLQVRFDGDFDWSGIAPVKPTV
jgi:hypothetical protein